MKKLRVKFNDRIVKEIPVFATAAAAVVLSIFAIVLSQTSIEVERDPGVTECDDEERVNGE